MTQEQVQLLLAANALLQRAGPVNVALNGQMGAGRSVMADTARLATGLAFRNDGRGPVWRSVLLSGTPREAPGAIQAGFTIDKRAYRMDGAPLDPNSIRQGDRVIIVVSGKPEGARLYPTVVVDLLPAGLEIETVLGPADGWALCNMTARAPAAPSAGSVRSRPPMWRKRATIASWHRQTCARHLSCSLTSRAP